MFFILMRLEHGIIRPSRLRPKEQLRLQIYFSSDKKLQQIWMDSTIEKKSQTAEDSMENIVNSSKKS